MTWIKGFFASQADEPAQAQLSQTPSAATSQAQPQPSQTPPAATSQAQPQPSQTPPAATSQAQPQPSQTPPAATSQAQAQPSRTPPVVASKPQPQPSQVQSSRVTESPQREGFFETLPQDARLEEMHQELEARRRGLDQHLEALNARANAEIQRMTEENDNRLREAEARRREGPGIQEIITNETHRIFVVASVVYPNPPGLFILWLRSQLREEPQEEERSRLRESAGMPQAEAESQQKEIELLQSALQEGQTRNEALQREVETRRRGLETVGAAPGVLEERRRDLGILEREIVEGQRVNEALRRELEGMGAEARTLIARS